MVSNFNSNFWTISGDCTTRCQLEGSLVQRSLGEIFNFGKFKIEKRKGEKRRRRPKRQEETCRHILARDVKREILYLVANQSIQS